MEVTNDHFQIYIASKPLTRGQIFCRCGSLSVYVCLCKTYGGEFSFHQLFKCCLLPVLMSFILTFYHPLFLKFLPIGKSQNCPMV